MLDHYVPVMLDHYVKSNPEIMHGTVCFVGTRVPLQSFFQHLKVGYSIDGFVEMFPSVKKEQVVGLLELLSESTNHQLLATSA
jgi:uncharacterized protein (DUF433 family)